MHLFLQSCGAVLLAVILMLSMGSQGKDLSMMVSVCVCIIVMTVALSYLQPVLDFVESLVNLGGLNSRMVEILMKSTGICLIGEIASLICADSGNSSMGKVIQLLGSVVILCLSLPLFDALIELLQEIMGDL